MITSLLERKKQQWEKERQELEGMWNPWGNPDAKTFPNITPIKPTSDFRSVRSQPETPTPTPQAHSNSETDNIKTAAGQIYQSLHPRPSSPLPPVSACRTKNSASPPSTDHGGETSGYHSEADRGSRMSLRPEKLGHVPVRSQELSERHLSIRTEDDFDYEYETFLRQQQDYDEYLREKRQANSLKASPTYAREAPMSRSGPADPRRFSQSDLHCVEDSLSEGDMLKLSSMSKSGPLDGEPSSPQQWRRGTKRPTPPAMRSNIVLGANSIEEIEYYKRLERQHKEQWLDQLKQQQEEKVARKAFEMQEAQRAKWGDRGITVGRLWDPLDERVIGVGRGKEVQGPPQWMERCLDRSGPIVVGSNSDTASNASSIPSASSVRSKTTPSPTNVQDRERMEKEKRRKMALEHQRAIQLQMEERQMRLARERERRRKEEQDEEERLRIEQEQIRKKYENEKRSERERKEADAKQEQAMKEAIEHSKREAQKLKQKKKHSRTEGSDSEIVQREQVNREEHTKVQEYLLNNNNRIETIPPREQQQQQHSNINSRERRLSPTEEYRSRVSPIEEQQRMIKTPSTIRQQSRCEDLENLNISHGSDSTIHLDEVPALPPYIQNRVLTPTKYRRKSEAREIGIQTDAFLRTPTRKDTGVSTEDEMDRTKRQKAKTKPSRDGTRRSGTTEKPKWSLSHPHARYIKQSEKDPGILRRKLRARSRECETGTESEDCSYRPSRRLRPIKPQSSDNTSRGESPLGSYNSKDGRYKRTIGYRASSVDRNRTTPHSTPPPLRSKHSKSLRELSRDAKVTDGEGSNSSPPLPSGSPPIPTHRRLPPPGSSRRSSYDPSVEYVSPATIDSLSKGSPTKQLSSTPENPVLSKTFVITDTATSSSTLEVTNSSVGDQRQSSSDSQSQSDTTTTTVKGTDSLKVPVTVTRPTKTEDGSFLTLDNTTNPPELLQNIQKTANSPRLKDKADNNAKLDVQTTNGIVQVSTDPKHILSTLSSLRQGLWMQQQELDSLGFESDSST